MVTFAFALHYSSVWIFFFVCASLTTQEKEKTGGTTIMLISLIFGSDIIFWMIGL
jgi:hypothetical protein